MAEIDSLQISIKSEVTNATKAIDTLIGKIGELSNSIKSINVSNISSQVSKLTASFKNINGGGFLELNKAAKEAKGSISSIVDASGKVLASINNTSKGAEQSLNRVSNATKKVSDTKLTFNTSDYNKAIQQLSVKFSEIGKDFKISDNLKQLEKQSSKLSTELDKLSQKEQKIISIGRIAPDSTGFIGLQYNISKTVNELGILTDKINQLKSTASNTSGIEIIRGDNAIVSLEHLQKELQSMDDLMQKVLTRSQIDTFVSNLEDGLGKLKQLFPEQTQLIEDYKNKIESLKNLSIKIPEIDARNSFKGIPESARYSTQEAQRTLNEAMSQVHAEVPTEQFRNYTKEIAEATAKLKELEAAGKGMGSNEWEKAYLELAKVKNEAREYKNTLDRHAKGLDEDIQSTKILREQLKQLQVPEIKENNLDKLQNQLEKTKQKMASLKTELQNKLTMGKITASVDDSGYVRMREQIALTGKTISALQDRIKVFGDASEKVNSLGNRVEELKSHINNLQSQGFKAGDVEFDKATAALQRAEQELKQYKAILAQPSKGLQEDIQKTNSLGNHVEELRKKLDELKGRGLNFGDKEFDKAYSELQKAESELSKYKSSLNNTQKSSTAFADKTAQAFSKISNAAKNMVSGVVSTLGKFGSALTLNRGNLNNLTNGMSGFRATTSSTISSVGSLTKQIAAASGVYLGLYGAIKGIKSSIDFASSLTEVQNVINVTFGKSAKVIEDFAKTSIQQFGLSELSAKQTAGRYQAMGTALGIPTKQMANMSVELTKLSADMASFYDVAQSDVAKSLQSVFTGTTAPMRRYGVDLTVATLEEYAHKRGIDAKIKSMSQAEKMMLRYAYVMERTGAAQGDFERTIHTWHNQMTLLKENFRELSGVIGTGFINALKPVVEAINGVMGKVIAFSKTVLSSLGKIFGWTYEDTGGGVVNDFADEMEDGASGAGDLADSMEDVADATDDAEKKQKKYNKQLSKIDELMNFTFDKTKDKKDKDKDKDKDQPSIGDLADIGGEYGAGGEWKKSKSIFKEFESELDSLYKLGDYIGQKLTKAMESIPWDSIYEKARNFGSGLASFLTGLISPELFSALGKTVAGSINTALHTLDSFGGTFDWTNFGNSLASGLNSFLGNIDWNTALSAANNWGEGIANALNAFIKKTDFDLIGETVANFVNTAVSGALKLVDNFNFAGVGKAIATALNSFIKKTDFNKAGTLIAKFVNGAAKTALTFAGNFNFKGVGKSIATFINSALGDIKWKTILTAASAWGKGIAEAINSFFKETDFTLIGSTVGNFINTAINFALSAGKELDFKGIGQKIADGINGAFATIDFAGLAETINTWVKGALTTVTTLLQETDFEAIGQKIGTFLAELDILSMMGQFAQMLWEAIKAGFSLLGGLIQEAPLETALIAAFAAFKFLGIGSVIGSAISSAISSALVTKLAAKLGVDLMANSSITSVLSTALSTKLAPAIKVVTDNIGTIATAVGTAVGAFAEFNVAKGAMENLTLGIENSTLGIGDFIAEIGKIGGAIALAVAAFTKALGQPAGTIIALIAGAVGAIKGISDAFEEIQADSAMEAVADALKKPGGTPIEDLTKLYEDNINTIKSGFDGINEKSKELETTQNNAEATSKKIDLIKFAVENGSQATEENTVKIKDAFDSLLSDTESIFEQEYDIIMTGISGALSQSLIDAGYNVKEIVGVMDDLKDGHQKAIDDIKTKNEELSKSFEAGEITNEEYQTKLLENYEQLGKITGKTDEYTTSINKVSDAIKDVDLSSIVNEDNTINTEKLSGTFKQLSNTADDAKKSINESSEGLTSAIEDYRAEAERMGNSKAATILSDTLSLEKENVKKATDGVNGELTAYGEAVETALIEKIPTVIEEAKKKHGEKGWLYQSFHSESEDVQKAIEEYKKSTIEPTGKELEKLYSEAGVEWSSKASSATEDVLKSLFEPYNDQGVYTIAYDSLQGNYSDVIEKAVKKVSPDAKKGGKEITQTMSDSMPEGVDEKKADEAGKKLTNKAKKSIDKKELKKGGKEGGKALSDGIPEGIDTKKAESAGKKVADKVTDKAIKEIKAKSKDIGSQAVNSTVTGLDENWKKVDDWWKKAKMPEVKFTIEDIKSKVSAKWKEVTDWWGESRKLKVDTSFITNENNVSSWWKKIKEWWGTKKLEVENSFKTTDSNVKSWWKKITDWWGTKKLEINSDFKTIQSEVNKWWTDKVKKWWGTKKLEVNSKFTTEKSTVVSWWTDKVKSWWGDREVKVGTAYTTKESTVNGWGKDTVKWLKDGISGAWGDFSKWFLDKFKGIVNKVVSGLNWVLKEVGSDDRVDKWTPKYAKGSSGLSRDTIGIVNDQSGNTYREMIVPPHGKPFIPKGRNVTLPMEKGTKIMPARQTKKFIESMPRFAKGAGKFSGNIFDYFDKPEKIIHIATDKFVDYSNLKKASLSISKGAVKALENSSVDYIKKIFASAGGGAGVERAVNWAIGIANDDSHGYDQNSRWGHPDFDCSSLVISAFEQAGIKLKSAGADTTKNLLEHALQIGFADVTNSTNRANGAGMRRGDILLHKDHHAALYIGDGQLVNASINEKNTTTGGQPGDQNGREILVRGYYNHPWTNILRYTKQTSSGGGYIGGDTAGREPNTPPVKYNPKAGVEQWRDLAIKALQITGQYTPDNLVYLLEQMRHESDGNPRAINNWDINAKNGNNSRGLLQVTPENFVDFAMKGYDKDIYDPLSNMITAIRLAVHDYGSLYKAWAARGYQGYATGIGKINLADIIKGFAKGGISKDELGVVNDQSGNVYKELVIPPHGTPFIPEGRNVTLPLQKGTRIIPADKTKKFLKSLPHFADGTEDFSDSKESKDSKSSITDKISKAIDDTLIPYIREIIKVLENNVGSSGSSSSKKKATTKYSDTVAEIQQAWINLAQWFETTVVQPIETRFSTMKTNILGVFSTANEELSKSYTDEALPEWQDTLSEIPGWIYDNICIEITDKFNTCFSDIADKLNEAWGNTQDTLSQMVTWIDGSITSVILSKFSDIFAQIENGYTAMWSNMFASAKPQFDGISQALDDTAKKINDLIARTSKAIEALNNLKNAENTTNVTESGYEEPEESHTSNTASFPTGPTIDTKFTTQNAANLSTSAITSPFTELDKIAKATNAIEEAAKGIKSPTVVPVITPIVNGLGNSMQSNTTQGIANKLATTINLPAAKPESSSKSKGAYTSMLAGRAKDNINAYTSMETKISDALNTLQGSPSKKKVTSTANGILNKLNNMQDLYNSKEVKPIKTKIMDALGNINAPNSIKKIKNAIKDLKNITQAAKSKVKTYATGGFPEDGWFRASKGEFMGQFDDGTSYVANNQQIQKAISAEVGGAVYNAVMAAMVNSNSNNGGDIVVNVDGESLFRIMKNKDSSFYSRTGRGAFEH